MQEQVKLKRPGVTFNINKEKDTQKIVAFLCRPDPIRDGINFPEVIFSRLLGLKEEIKPEEPIEQIVGNYVARYYQDHDKIIQAQLKTIDLDWHSVSVPFYEAMDTIFGNSPWPYQNFRGIYTITYPCPRFLESGEFQVYPSRRGHHKTTIAHELHHFRFFEYLRLNYCPEVVRLEEIQIVQKLFPRFIVPAWELSEALVKAHFNDPPFAQLLPRTEDYPGLADTFLQVNNLWQQSGKNLPVFMRLIEK